MRDWNSGIGGQQTEAVEAAAGTEDGDPKKERNIADLLARATKAEKTLFTLLGNTCCWM